jgi:hypothetical protein
MMALPGALSSPLQTHSGRPIRGLLLDLTVYLGSFTEDDLATLMRWYRCFAPAEAWRRYMVEDNTVWDSVPHPRLLTRLGVLAAQSGDPLPFLAPVRARLQQGRRFWVQIWDGLKTDSWSLCIRAIHRQDGGLRPFARLMIPAHADPQVLARAAFEWSEFLDIRSGHGNLTFSYNPWFLDRAFDDIHALAKRFWGIEVEHLNGTLPLMTDRIKGVSWLTLVGDSLRSLVDQYGVATSLARLPGVSVHRQPRALLIQLGPSPAIGDQNRPDGSLNNHYAAARELASLYLDQHPDFPGAFVTAGDSSAWVRRFVEPGRWR